MFSAPGNTFWLEANELPLESDVAPAWEEGEQGSFDFTPANAPNFLQFSGLCTNGIEGTITSKYELHDSQHWVIGHKLWTESTFFDMPIDLVGQEVEFVRLVVHGVDFWEDGEYAHMNADLTWEFWGTVPEPASLFGLALVIMVISTRGRRMGRSFATSSMVLLLGLGVPCQIAEAQAVNKLEYPSGAIETGQCYLGPVDALYCQWVAARHYCVFNPVNEGPDVPCTSSELCVEQVLNSGGGSLSGEADCSGDVSWGGLDDCGESHAGCHTTAGFSIDANESDITAAFSFNVLSASASATVWGPEDCCAQCNQGTGAVGTVNARLGSHVFATDGIVASLPVQATQQGYLWVDSSTVIDASYEGDWDTREIAASAVVADEGGTLCNWSLAGELWAPPMAVGPGQFPAEPGFVALSFNQSQTLRIVFAPHIDAEAAACENGTTVVITGSTKH